MRPPRDLYTIRNTCLQYVAAVLVVAAAAAVVVVVAVAVLLLLLLLLDVRNQYFRPICRLHTCMFNVGVKSVETCC